MKYTKERLSSALFVVVALTQSVDIIKINWLYCRSIVFMCINYGWVCLLGQWQNGAMNKANKYDN